MKVIRSTQPGGRISITRPAPSGRLSGETEDEQIARVLARDIPGDHTDVEVIDDASIPTDRAFRNAWSGAPGTVSVDMPKARAIHMDRIRAARNAKLAALDPEWMRETGRGDAVRAAAIEAQRETLRNIPQTLDLDAVADPDALKAVWPAELD